MPAILGDTQLRSAGNAAAMSGDLEEAVRLYTRALELPSGHARHMLLSNRSAALLQLGRWEPAVVDAQEATECAPAAPTSRSVPSTVLSRRLCHLYRNTPHERDDLCVVHVPRNACNLRGTPLLAFSCLVFNVTQYLDVLLDQALALGRLLSSKFCERVCHVVVQLSSSRRRAFFTQHVLAVTSNVLCVDSRNPTSSLRHAKAVHTAESLRCVCVPLQLKHR